MYSVKVSVDDYDDQGEPVSRTVATFQLEHDKEHPELYEIVGHPVSVKIDDDLTIDLTCERVGDGSLNFSISHNEFFLLAGKYHGPFTVRMFAKSGSTYVVDVKERE